MTKNTVKFPGKVKATKNTAKDVVQPKMKAIPLPSAVAAEVGRRVVLMDNYIAGVVGGMGIKGPWGFDPERKCIMVPE